jgi:CarD family transcriptional regulator
MAARKKVTKTAAKAPAEGGVIRQKSQTSRGLAAESKAGVQAISEAGRGTASAEAAGKAEFSNIISVTSSKKGMRQVAPASTAVKAESAPRKTTGAGTAGLPKAVLLREPKAVLLKEPKAVLLREPKAGFRHDVNAQSTDLDQSKDIHRSSAKPASPGPVRSEYVAAAGMVETVAKAPATGAAGKPAVGAAVASAAAPETAKTTQETAKTTKVSAQAKTIDREPSGGEQKTMKNSANKHGFKLNEFVVYPAHGVGQIVAMEEQEVAGFKLELFVINFVKDKMTLRVPTSKVAGVGMRKLSDPEAARRSLEILTGRARVKRTMWSRRAQEYEAKINSGDINAIAEVVRDLFRSEAQPEQSYSERQLYEAALDRMMREIAAVQKLSETEALKVIDTQLKKNTKRGLKPDAAEGDEAGIEEAA